MDMTDNELVEKLFKDIRQMEMPDDGFTERVMRQIPDVKAQTLSRLWTTCCIVIGVVLFVLVRGWEPVCYRLVMLVNNMSLLQSHLLLIMAATMVVGLITISDVFRRERYSVI